MKRKIALYKRLLAVMEQTEDSLSTGAAEDMREYLEEIMAIHRELAGSLSTRNPLSPDPEQLNQLGACLRMLMQKTERLKTMAATKKAAIADELQSLSRAMRLVPSYRDTAGTEKTSLSITS